MASASTPDDDDRSDSGAEPAPPADDTGPTGDAMVAARDSAAVLSNPLPPASDRLPPMRERTSLQTTVSETLRQSRDTAVVLTGPHGAGKTLLAQHVLEDLPDGLPTCYLSGRQQATAYAVLRHFYWALTGTDPGTGYHTSQLQSHVAEACEEQDHVPVLVVDDLAFLLVNDGRDLLYGLSRMDAPIRLLMAAATIPDETLRRTLGARTYSSVRPHHFTVDAYSVVDAAQILQARTEQAGATILPAATAEQVAATTTNLRVGLHWIARAQELAAETGTDPDTLAAVSFDRLTQDALDRYRRDVLAPFSIHQHLLLAAIRAATALQAAAYTGDVYEWYQQLCEFQGERPHTLRRLSTYLTHLDLLGLIDVTHHRGGVTGKTRSIRLVPIEEL